MKRHAMPHVALPCVRVRLPATSANLGPGFDAVGLALSLFLTVEAVPADVDTIAASGRNAQECGTVRDNLILNTYQTVSERFGRTPLALRLNIENEIPLGMGCGSSAAARLAGVALANTLGELHLGDEQIVAAASELEGHPDNVAACWHGGFTVSVPHQDGLTTVTLPVDENWEFVLALPGAGVETTKARGVLPAQYSREDAVFNVQRSALLTAAIASSRLDLLRVAMQDRMHQPQRRSICGLLVHLDALLGSKAFAGVALSGAGPALLTVLAERTSLHAAQAVLQHTLGADVEILSLRASGGTSVKVLSST